MPFSGLDTRAIARALARIADRPDDVAEVFFERVEEVEAPTEPGAPGVAMRCEEGLAVRLLRGESCWLAAADVIDGEALGQALRRVARTLPSTPQPLPDLAGPPAPAEVDAAETLLFPGAVERAIRERHVAFPLRLGVRRHRRWIRVIGVQVAPEQQAETYFSCSLRLPWGRYGTLLTALDEAAVEEVAAAAIELFRARDAPPAPAGARPVVLGPEATAVLLHEAVGHALETDTLVAGGDPESACDHPLGSSLLDVLDDPGALPDSLRRTTDDEGMPVIRRWLLRRGVVQQPLADLFYCRGSSRISPGAARRASRHAAPVPRSLHLELLAGETGEEELLAAAAGGLYLPRAASGSLDPATGEFELDFPFGREVEGGEIGAFVGPCRLRGRVAQLLTAIAAVGDAPRLAGAGWCAKDGHKVPVWATCPAVAVEGLELA